ncbi:MAG: hypothetical protein HYS17_03935 [Micavibrio aeruginosavorus]|uniref:Uncharacterized protein n=1 Tax=Micavibrio aeruginosavorus TaxID=349221 RepID=A0A7T5UHG4_9BACT|nr:MAG: hypothetical protein HYS17_03935 [Micavibrio aeruginosavorus]
MTRFQSPDTGRNWVNWLREQAAQAYVWDEAGQYHRVIAPRGPTARTLREAWQSLSAADERFPSLKHNLFVGALPRLPLAARAQINAFFSAQGLRDFEFLDHGGRAIAFRAYHLPSRQFRIARMEAPHGCRYARPRHPAILQPFASNEGRMKAYGDIKLEILPEVMPLAKLYKACDADQVKLLRDLFHEAVLGLSWGTNLMYPATMFDRDAEPQNVGVRPDGRIVSFDPQIITGAPAQAAQRHFKTPGILKDASTTQLALIYPAF